MSSVKRTKQSFEELGELASRDVGDNINDVFGHKGLTPLLKIPYFDPEKMVPVEPMHLVSGVVTKLLEICVLNNKEKTVHWRNVVHHKINEGLRNIELPTEFQRRIREIDLVKNKSQELKTFLIFGFDVICRVLVEYDAKDEAEVFSNISWLVRVIMMPDGWFQRMAKEFNLSYQTKIMYRKFEAVFSPDQCTANIHNLFSHLLDWRLRGQLRHFTAEPFESSYGQNKKRFRPGTDSEGTQIMTNGFIANENGHFCFKTMRVLPYNSGNSEDNSMFADSRMNLYQCQEVLSDKEVRAKRLFTGKYVASYMRDRYNWSMAGVFAIKKICAYSTVVQTKDIAAKAVLINKNVVALATRDMMAV